MRSKFSTKIEDGISIYSGMLSVNCHTDDFFKNKKIWNNIANLMGQVPENILKNDGLPQEEMLCINEKDMQVHSQDSLEEMKGQLVDPRKDIQTLYYDGVINCIYPDEKLRSSKSYQYTHHYRLPINCKISLLDTPDSIEVNVTNIDFYILSKDQLIYCIQTNIAGKNIEEINLQNQIIRNVEYYPNGFDDKSISINFLKLFTPIIEIHNHLNKENIPVDDYSPQTLKQFAYTLFRGNKLKIYLAMQLPDDPVLLHKGYSTDKLLYELATCNIGVMLNPNNSNYPDLKYYNELIENNTIACFANWKALALLDSFIVLFQPGNRVSYNWKEYYFKYLYINVLCIRSFLVSMNEKYKRKNITSSIENEFILFDRTFNFHTVSYNFLPNIIYKKMRSGMEINEELEELKNKINHFSEKQDLENEKTTSHILFWLAILTIFSAFSDALQLYMNVPHAHRNLLTIVLTTLITACILYKFSRKSN